MIDNIIDGIFAYEEAIEIERDEIESLISEVLDPFRDLPLDEEKLEQID